MYGMATATARVDLGMVQWMSWKWTTDDNLPPFEQGSLKILLLLYSLSCACRCPSESRTPCLACGWNQQRRKSLVWSSRCARLPCVPCVSVVPVHFSPWAAFSMSSAMPKLHTIQLNCAPCLPRTLSAVSPYALRFTRRRTGYADIQPLSAPHPAL
jgi:hypothetical protein